MSEKLSRVSPRKIAANRQNALKSTGPKTPQGKAHSRNNSLKHGLFAMNFFVGAAAKAESREQYQQLLDQLTHAYDPVGAAEQLEVERITACWWKLGRAWRYENSEICYAQCEAGARLDDLMSRNSPIPTAPITRECLALDLLTRAGTEIEFTGRLSDELKRDMDAPNEIFQPLWAHAQKVTEIQLAQASYDNRRAAADPKQAWTFLLENVQTGIQAQENRIKEILDSIGNRPYDNRAVPKAEVLDRVIRADSAAERSLNRAIDRLERLQRRRQGESVPPPVNVRLTR
jgi:hypothetical protein